MESTAGTRLRGLFASTGGVHAIFGTKVADYVASRPDYPAALLAELRRRCPPPALAADVGAGTGLLTRDLLRSGYYVVAVEPNDEMRQACDHLLAGVPRCRSVPGSAESIPLPDGSVSLITAAQAFHWFDLERSRREFRRVLAPNGLVALIWNERIDTDPLHAALDRVLSHFGGEKWKLLGIQEQRAGVDAFFGQRPASHSWPHAHALDREGLRSLVFSRSYIPGRQTPADADVVQAVDEVFERFCPAGGSSVLVRYETILLIEQIR